MRSIRYYSAYSLIFTLMVLYQSRVQVVKNELFNYSNISQYVFAINQTVTSTPTPSASVTLTEMVTDTAIPSITDGTATQSPSVTNTMTGSPQPTETTTVLPSSTITLVPSLTLTYTPDYTKTPEATNTLIPLPSITLLFPAETVTPTQNATQIALSTQVTSSIVPSGINGTNRISAQSILLIGTLILLWSILAMFVIFYVRKINE